MSVPARGRIRAQASGLPYACASSPTRSAGVVSDIDDTVMVSMLPRLVTAAITRVRRPRLLREAVPRMAYLLTTLTTASAPPRTSPRASTRPSCTCRLGRGTSCPRFVVPERSGYPAGRIPSDGLRPLQHGMVPFRPRAQAPGAAPPGAHVPQMRCPRGRRRAADPRSTPSSRETSRATLPESRFSVRPEIEHHGARQLRGDVRTPCGPFEGVPVWYGSGREALLHNIRGRGTVGPLTPH